MIILSIVMMFSIVGMFGLPETMIRNIAKDYGAGKLINVKQTLVTTVTLMITITTCVATLIILGGGELILVSIFSVPNTNNIVLLMTAWMFLHCTHILIAECFRGFHKIKHAVLFTGTARTALTLIALGALYISPTGINLQSALLANTIGLLATIIISIYLLPTSIPSLPNIKISTTYKDTLKQATPLFLDTLAYQIFLRIGLWALGYYVSKEDVALYGAALQLVTLSLAPLKIINSIIPPLIADMYFNDKDKSRLEKTIRSVSTIAAIPMILAMIMFLVFGDQILALIFGSFYSQGHLILIIMTLGYATDIILGPTGYLLKMTQNHGLLLKINLAFGLLTVILSIIAAKYSGVAAVAFATTVVMIAKNIYTLHRSHKKTDVLAGMYVNPGDLKTMKTSLTSYLGAKRNSPKS